MRGSRGLCRIERRHHGAGEGITDDGEVRHPFRGDGLKQHLRVEVGRALGDHAAPAEQGDDGTNPHARAVHLGASRKAHGGRAGAVERLGLGH